MVWGILYHAVVVVLVALFTLSALLKLAAPREFIKLVQAYDVLPRRMATVYGAVLPFAEVTGAVLLVNEKTSLSGAMLLCVLLLGIGYAVYTVVKTGRNVQCACYGRFFEAEADRFTLWKTVLLIVFALLTATFRDRLWVGFSGPAVLFGLYMTTLILLAQKVWISYRKAWRVLTETERPGESG